jgi:hypothetical protein
MGIQLDGSSQYATLGSALLGTLPYTVSIWGKAATGNPSGTYAAFGIYSTTTNDLRASIWRDGAGDVISTWARVGGTNGLATTTTSYSANTWHHVFSRFVSNVSRFVRLDGGGLGPNTTPVTPLGLDQTAIGAQVVSSPALYFDGILGEIGVWNRDFTQEEYEALRSGASPLFFPQNLIAYWPLIDDWSDWSGNGRTMSPTNSPSFIADHPPVFQPRGIQSTILLPAVAAIPKFDNLALLGVN